MDAERLRQIEQLYHAARENRAALDNVDEELRGEVESLLAQDATLPDLQIDSTVTQLATGSSLGPYKIEVKLGAGGMGEVFRARDTRLGRTVAIKILPRVKTADPEHKRRFMQEARAASTLNHPNIVTIYDIGNSEGIDFIAMEYVPGRTLNQCIGPKGMNFGEVLNSGIQISEALAAAHAAGIVHRDLKPSNVMLTEQGLVKVLDFGLAKLSERPPDPENPGGTRTMKYDEAPLTEEGAIIGTVAYMSPEQAEGNRVDPRSDIFSFGSVLYEMLTGRQAFSGQSKLATLSAILHQEPKPLHELLESPPRDMEVILARCLRKDPARRFQHIEDLKVALLDLKEESESRRLATSIVTPEGGKKTRRDRMAAAVGAVALALLVGLAIAGRGILRPASNPNSLKGTDNGRLTLLLSSENAIEDPALSPDGRMVVYVAQDGGQADLFVARVAGGGRVRVTNDAALEESPQFSPDGERIVFTRVDPETASSEIWVVPAFGGQATRLIPRAAYPAWSPDGARLAFVLGADLATAAADGTGARILQRSSSGYFFRSPAWSPDGRFLAVVRSSGGVTSELWIVPMQGGSPRRLTNDAPGVWSDQPVFTADGRGLVHESNRAGATNLWIILLDGGSLVRLTTGPGPDGSPSAARNGAVAFANSRYRYSLIVHNLGTDSTRELLTHSSYIWGPAFSPDGRDVAFTRGEADGSWHIWITPSQGGPPRQLTFGSLPEIYPRFSPDGASVIYHTWSAGPDRIWRAPRAGGPAVPLTPSRDDDDSYGDISPDGRWLAFARTEKSGTHIYVSPLEGGEAKRLTDAESTLPRWSPNGKWIAFSPNRNLGGVFVMSAEGGDARRLAQRGGWAVWWPDGKRLGYQNIGPDGNEEILTVPFEGGLSKPLPGVRYKSTNNPFDISADGASLATSHSVHLASEIWLLEPPK